MRHIDFDPIDLDGEQLIWWNRWIAISEAEQRIAIKHVESGIEPVFKERVWKELKEWLLENVFFGHCAYCESVVDDTSWGAADHYRPKGRVTVLVGERRQVVFSGDQPHPGYYWLAYDWRNLVPSCDKCNTEGKRDQFPVAGERATSHLDFRDVEELDSTEKPLLLHPYFTNPRNHLRFEAHGIVAVRDNSECGEATVEVCDLRRSRLRDARRVSQENAWNAFVLAFAIGPERLRECMSGFQTGLREHSTACLDYIELKRRLNDMAISGSWTPS